MFTGEDRAPMHELSARARPCPAPVARRKPSRSTAIPPGNSHGGIADDTSRAGAASDGISTSPRSPHMPRRQCRRARRCEGDAASTGGCHSRPSICACANGMIEYIEPGWDARAYSRKQPKSMAPRTSAYRILNLSVNIATRNKANISMRERLTFRCANDILPQLIQRLRIFHERAH